MAPGWTSSAGARLLLVLAADMVPAPLLLAMGTVPFNGVSFLLLFGHVWTLGSSDDRPRARVGVRSMSRHLPRFFGRRVASGPTKG